MVALSDTLATYSLDKSYENCAYPTPYDGRILPFSLNLAWRTPAPFGMPRRTNNVLTVAVNMSFALCPPPRVWHFSAGVCDETAITGNDTNGLPDYTAYTDCQMVDVAGYGSLGGIMMLGYNLWANVYIGNDSVGWYTSPSNNNGGH